MPILTLTQAAKATGISRPMLYRRIKSGHLSTIRQADGTKGIDSAELMRVFGKGAVTAIALSTREDVTASILGVFAINP